MGRFIVLCKLVERLMPSEALLQSHLFGGRVKLDVIFDFRQQLILGYLLSNFNQRASPKSR